MLYSWHDIHFFVFRDVIWRSAIFITFCLHVQVFPYGFWSFRCVIFVVPPFCRLTLCQKSFYPYAPTLWNYLPEDIIQCNSLQSFKSALRSPGSVAILASQFHCLFWFLFFSVFFFNFPNYFCCFVVFGLPLIYCFWNIGLCQALGPNGINK